MPRNNEKVVPPIIVREWQRIVQFPTENGGKRYRTTGFNDQAKSLKRETHCVFDFGRRDGNAGRATRSKNPEGQG
jgi:hypothetical protein